MTIGAYEAWFKPAFVADRRDGAMFHLELEARRVTAALSLGEHPSTSTEES